MLLQITQVSGHHCDIRSPVFFQTYEYAHSDGMYPRLTHPVKSIAPPVKVRLHSAWMINVVIGPVVGLLEANHPVKSVMRKLFVLFCLQRHNLYLQVREILLGPVQCLRKVGNTRLVRILARHYEQILKRRQFLDCAVFVLALLRRQYHPRHRIACVKSAIDAMVYAGIGYVKGNEHRNGLSEAFLRIALAESCHSFQPRLGRGRNQCHKVLYVTAFLCQSPPDVGIGL